MDSSPIITTSADLSLLTRFNSSKHLISNITFERLLSCLSLLPSKIRSFPDPIETIVTIAPGRVNLIGEHVDYEGFPVLPMAISLNVICCLGIVTKSSLDVDSQQTRPKSNIFFYNAQPDQYPPVSIPFHPLFPDTIDINHFSTSWVKYPLCAIKSLFQMLNSMTPNKMSNNYDFHFSFDGTIPSAAGLSSSSAMVCASVNSLFSTRFTQKHLKKTFSKTELTKISQDSERLIGMESGGMDQAICFFGENQKAMRINFQPKLSFKSISLSSVFSQSKLLVINSNESSFKHLTMGSNYNYRVTECKIASLIIDPKHRALSLYDALKSLLEARKADFPTITDPVNLEFLHFIIKQLQSRESTTDTDDSPQQHATSSQFSDFPIGKISWKDFESLFQSFSTNQPLETLPILSDAVKAHMDDESTFQPFKRAYHVISETMRVLEFEKILQSTTSTSSENLSLLGNLLKESHKSLSEIYKCSTPKLDEIVKTLDQAGSYGSRLVGAGWGGCAISLIPLDFSLPASLQDLPHFFCSPANGIQSFPIPNILACSDSWKDSLSSSDVNASITDSLRLCSSLANIQSVSISDGGEGFLDLAKSPTFTQFSADNIVGPLGQGQMIDSVPFSIGTLSSTSFGEDGMISVGIVEMAKSSGIELVPTELRNPLNTTTYGTGQVILKCIQKGVQHIILGAGGSSTNDAGLGALQALGLLIYTNDGLLTTPLKGRDLPNILKIEWSPDAPIHKLQQIWIGCDVDNPFYGDNGAVAVYSAQKGATPDIQKLLEAAMKRLSTKIFPSFIQDNKILLANLSDLGSIPKTGTAGGISGGFLYTLGTSKVSLLSGFDIFSSITNLAPKLANSSIIFTGEGKLDSQSMQGKVLSRVYHIGAKNDSKFVFLVGCRDASFQISQLSFSNLVLGVFSTSETFGTEESLTNPRICIRKLVETILQGFE